VVDASRASPRNSAGMIEIAGAQFPLTFETQLDREVVFLGVVPVGAIYPSHGLYIWSVDLPIARRNRKSRSLARARDELEALLQNWFEAAAAARVVRRPLPAAARASA
jgi:hypothetical protein